MADIPFHVAGASFHGKKQGAAALPLPVMPLDLSDGASIARPSGSRRRKLWELPHKFHCPVIGVCFGCDELRGLMGKILHLPHDTSDFVLHTTAVGNCEERTALAELLHKTLERRFQLVIKQFSRIKTNADLRLSWRRACKEATQIPASLWAVWTHPACDSRLEQEVYGDIHMIQHQIGAGTRADVRQLQVLEASKLTLEDELSRMRSELDVLRQDKIVTVNGFRQQITDLRADLVAKESWGQQLHNELLALRSTIPDLDCRQELLRQRDEVWQQNVRLKAELAARDKEVLRLSEFARYAEETLESLVREDEMQAALPATDLAGKCVLCVGGRSSAVTSYRDVVEQSGGRFLHHDGGLEESLHRIDGVLAAADIVICQAGCISHNAYWRVKDLCKRTGKPCMFVKNSGVTSFGRVINCVGKSAPNAGASD